MTEKEGHVGGGWEEGQIQCAYDVHCHIKEIVIYV